MNEKQPTPPSARRLRRARLAAAALAALASSAWCDSSPYTLGVDEVVMHDSNVFRIADNAPASLEGASTRADWISTTGLLGSIDQPIGRERFKANGEIDLDRFKNNTQLNSTAHSLGLEGDWATVDDLSGELGYSNSAQLYRYNLDVDQTLTARNVLQTDSSFARFHLGVVTAWTIDAVFNDLDLTYSADPYKPRDLRRWDGSLGATYQSSPDLKLTVSGRHTRGEYPNLTTFLIDGSGQFVEVTDPDHFSRNDLNLAMVYAATGASTFKVRVSAAHEDHSVITSRSFHLWSADGQWVWQPTGRTQFTLDFLRDDDTGSTDATLFLANADARSRSAVSAALNYELTSKIKLHATGSFAHRDLDSSFSDVPQFNTRGSDKLYDAGIGFDYTPERSIQLGCNASRERRTTSGDEIDITYPYSDIVLSCTGQFAFD